MTVAAIFAFQKEVKIYNRCVFLGIIIMCKYGEQIIKSQWERKVFVKRDERRHMARRTAFYNLPSPADRSAGNNNEKKK